MQSLGEKGRLDVPCIILEAQKRIVQRLAFIPERSVLSALRIARSNDVKITNESLQKQIDELKAKLPSRKDR